MDCGGKESAYSRALLRSLCEGSLLVGDLPEARVWDMGRLERDLGEAERLNFDQKLGHLYEEAMERVIVLLEDWDLLGRNIQVFGEDGRTLGELDFLVQERATGRVVHLELAVKFYMAVEGEGGVMRLPGPDPRDDWEGKLARLREHQLKLGNRVETRQLLRERFDVKAVETRQRVYGALFDHCGVRERARAPGLAKRYRRGRWLYSKDWDEYFSGVSEVRVIPKFLWPVAIERSFSSHLERATSSRLREMARERCVMFWDEESEESVFLVYDRWPLVG